MIFKERQDGRNHMENIEIQDSFTENLSERF